MSGTRSEAVIDLENLSWAKKCTAACDAGGAFYKNYLATVPFWARHAFLEATETQPLPLHPFLPEQSLLADLQAPLPEQSLTPAHFTPALPSPAEANVGTTVAKRPATAAATKAPFVVIFISLLLSVKVTVIGQLTNVRPRSYAHVLRVTEWSARDESSKPLAHKHVSLSGVVYVTREAALRTKLGCEASAFFLSQRRLPSKGADDSIAKVASAQLLHRGIAPWELLTT
jgi:hypothetical protein